MIARLLIAVAVMAGAAAGGTKPAIAKADGKAVPFHASYSGYLDTQSAATFQYKNFSGTATVLGKSTFTATAKYGERFGQGSGCFLEAGVGKLTAKSGTTLRFAYAFRGCEASVSTAPIAGNYLIYDGKKKLAGAQGSGKYTVSPNGIVTFNGTLVAR